MAEVTEALARAAEKLTGERAVIGRLTGYTIRESDGSWRPVPAVQSDPGWWLRALWMARYRVTFMGRGAVYIHDGRALNAVAGGEASDPLDALAAALADFGSELEAKRDAV